MIPVGMPEKRLMVPRWRTFGSALRSGELATRRSEEKLGARTLSPTMARRLVRWRERRDAISSAEVVATALAENREVEGILAAMDLVSHRSTATEHVREQAAMLLLRAGRAEAIPAGIATAIDTSAKAIRHRTVVYPDNPMAWVDLALSQAASRGIRNAERSILVALQLAPHNRHVLRSAARFYLHIGDPDRAHQLLSKAANLQSDPWLMAAEISVADLAKKQSKTLKVGQKLIDNQQFSPRQISELAGAVATAEMVNGKHRSANKLFRRSIEEPTGSALAQAEWAVPIIAEEFFQSGRSVAVDDANEATSFRLFRAGRIGEIADECKGWAASEPSSVRPLEFGSWAASVTDRYEFAVELANTGLSRSSGNPVLINTKAFSLINLGYYEGAAELLKSIRPSAGSQWYVSRANLGMIEFRAGDANKGIALYAEAIDGFSSHEEMHEYALIAKGYYAMELSRAGLPVQVIEEVTGPLKKRDDHQSRMLLRKIEQTILL